MAERIRGWRKLAGSAWGAPNDPQFYGELEIDVGAALTFLDELRAATGTKVTLTHLVGKAVAYGLTAVPELRVRFARSRAYPRESDDG